MCKIFVHVTVTNINMIKLLFVVSINLPDYPNIVSRSVFYRQCQGRQLPIKLARTVGAACRQHSTTKILRHNLEYEILNNIWGSITSNDQAYSIYDLQFCSGLAREQSHIYQSVGDVMTLV